MIFLGLPITGSAADVVETCASEIEGGIESASAETRNTLRRHFPLIRARIREYVAARGNAAAFANSPFPRSARKSKKKLDGDRLYDRYSSTAKGSASIRALVHARRRHSYCPYCGLWLVRKPKGRKDDCDHILPRSLYPEFSLARVNLVLICTECNLAKSDRVFNENGDWLFIHPYYDDFLLCGVLDASVTADGKTPVVAFRLLQDTLADAEYGRVTRHFIELDLESRYADQALREAVMVLGTHRAHVCNGAKVDEVREILEEQAEGIFSERPNDPLGCILKGLAVSGDLVQLLQQ